MAIRPAYFIKDGKVVRKDYDFEWFSGFAVTQKQKSIASLHETIKSSDSESKPLEISTKGTDSLGAKLSAFNLKLNGYTLENIFQSSKVFENGGPYHDLLNVHPKDAKRDGRLRTSGDLTAFVLGENRFPLEPKTLFYDYIYIQAVKKSIPENEMQILLNYTHYTDIEFNPQKSINTQAKSAAIIRLLLGKYGDLPEMSVNEFTVFHKQFVTA